MRMSTGIERRRVRRPMSVPRHRSAEAVPQPAHSDDREEGIIWRADDQFLFARGYEYRPTL
jgi:hypothetical protein